MTTYHRITFHVTADVPMAASITEAKDFIREWLSCGGGCRRPDDPLFHSFKRVRVVTARKPVPEK